MPRTGRAATGGNGAAPGAVTSRRRRSRSRRSRARTPSQTRAYRSRTRAAFAAKSGSRGKIHDRYRHGLIASACNQRRTVDDEIAATRPSRTAWPASSAELHLDNGTRRCSGGSHAIALMPATTSDPNRRGRPDRGRSARPAIPSSQNRFRHRDTTSTQTPTRAAMSTFCMPSAASSTIRARTTAAMRHRPRPEPVPRGSPDPRSTTEPRTATDETRQPPTRRASGPPRSYTAVLIGSTTSSWPLLLPLRTKYVRSDSTARAPKNDRRSSCRGTTRRCQRRWDSETIGSTRSPEAYVPVGETGAAPSLPQPDSGRAAQLQRAGAPPKQAADLAFRRRRSCTGARYRWLSRR